MYLNGAYCPPMGCGKRVWARPNRDGRHKLRGLRRPALRRAPLGDMLGTLGNQRADRVNL